MSQKLNPASTRDTSRVPMSIPLRKLEVPEIPGYHLHWMNGDPARIAQAQRAGYEFVDADEVNLLNTGLANDSALSGNADLGSRVSIVSGEGVPSLFLMKLKEEWWEEDQSTLEDRNEQVAASLRGGRDINSNPNEEDNRYIPDAHRKSVANIFTRKNRRS